jgi:hypothetical protein
VWGCGSGSGCFHTHTSKERNYAGHIFAKIDIPMYMCVHVHACTHTGTHTGTQAHIQIHTHIHTTHTHTQVDISPGLRALGRWFETIFPFAILLMMVFIYEHSRGLLVFLWLSAYLSQVPPSLYMFLCIYIVCMHVCIYVYVCVCVYNMFMCICMCEGACVFILSLYILSRSRAYYLSRPLDCSRALPLSCYLSSPPPVSL